MKIWLSKVVLTDENTINELDLVIQDKSNSSLCEISEEIIGLVETMNIKPIKNWMTLGHVYVSENKEIEYDFRDHYSRKITHENPSKENYFKEISFKLVAEYD